MWQRWLLIGAWLIAVGDSVVFVPLLKSLYPRPSSRLYFGHPLLPETNYSFPSGHAIKAVVLYGMLAYFALQLYELGEHTQS